MPLVRVSIDQRQRPIPKRLRLLQGELNLLGEFGTARIPIAGYPTERPRHGADGCQQHHAQKTCRYESALIPPCKLPQPIAGPGRRRLDRFVAQMPLDVPRQTAGRVIAPGPILVQALHHDPVQIAAHFLGELGRFGPSASGHVRQRVA